MVFFYLQIMSNRCKIAKADGNPEPLRTYSSCTSKQNNNRSVMNTYGLPRTRASHVAVLSPSPLTSFMTAESIADYDRSNEDLRTSKANVLDGCSPRGCARVTRLSAR